MIVDERRVKGTSYTRVYVPLLPILPVPLSFRYLLVSSVGQSSILGPTSSER